MSWDLAIRARVKELRVRAKICDSGENGAKEVDSETASQLRREALRLEASLNNL